MNCIDLTNNMIYLSGINLSSFDSISFYNIKYLLCCTPSDDAKLFHQRILNLYPDRTVIYLPFDDSYSQNLFHKWKKKIDTKGYDKYLSIYISNFINKPLIQIAFEIIDYSFEKKISPILVHCTMGISRSVSILIYYLMVKFNYTYTDSYNMIKNCRPVISPNLSFRMQLEYFDKFRQSYKTSTMKKVIKKCQKSRKRAFTL